MATEDDTRHQLAIHTAIISFLEYQTTYPTLAAKQQPTLEYGLKYLQHENTIINESTMRPSHTFTTGPNSPCIAATSSSGVTKLSTWYTGKPSNIRGKN
jgi:hypothetical protein